MNTFFRAVWFIFLALVVLLAYSCLVVWVIYTPYFVGKLFLWSVLVLLAAIGLATWALLAILNRYVRRSK